MRSTVGLRTGVLALLGMLVASSQASAQETLLEVDSGGDYYGQFYEGVDFDGDQVPDLLVPPGTRDRVWLLSGADGSLIKEFTGFAGTVKRAVFTPDMDDDQVPDLLVSISRGVRVDALPAQVVLVSGADGAAIWTADGNNSSESFGDELAVLGDLTSDGAPEILVGGYNVVRCLSGADGARLYEFFSTGSCCPSEKVVGIGDVNGDGVEDFLIGSLRYSGDFFGAPGVAEAAGRALVVSGRTGEVIRTHSGKAAVALVGSGVASLGDLDGDSVAEYVVGANIIKGKAFNPGFTVYSGRTGKKIVVVQTHAIPGVKRLDPLPGSPGDADRDGFVDMFVSGTDDDNGGFIGIVSGRPVENPLLFRLDAPEGDFFTSVGVAGDIDRDGVSDIVFGLSTADVVRVVRVVIPPVIPTKLKNARALSRPEDVDEEISAKLSVLVKNGVQTFSIVTQGLSAGAKSGDDSKAAVTGPFGVFLEDGVAAGEFTKVGSLDTSGAFVVTSTGTVPPELGVSSLADLVGRRVLLRDGADKTLLETVVPSLAKQKAAKAKGVLSPVSAEFPDAQLRLKASFNPKTGALDVKGKVKKAGDGPFVFELETAAASGVFQEIARSDDGKLKISTGSGAPLSGAFTIADLVGRGVRVLAGETIVLAGQL